MQISELALLLPVALYGIFFGYQVTNRALDRIERGHQTIGFRLFWAGFGLAVLRGALLPGFEYWLVFKAGPILS